MAYSQKIISGNRAVIISANEETGPFSCRVWVNVRQGFENADATTVSCKRQTLAGAVKWARGQLGLDTAWAPLTPAQAADAHRREASGFVNVNHD